MALRGELSFNWRKWLIVGGIVIVIVATTLIIINLVGRDKSDERYRVQGQVVDQYGQVVSGVQFCEGNKIIYTTSIDGRFSLENILAKTKIKIILPDDYSIVNDEIIVTKTINITSDSKGLIINVQNKNAQIKQIKIKTVDINNSVLASVRVYNNNTYLDKTSSSGIILIDLTNQNMELSFQLNDYYFMNKTIASDSEETEVIIRGIYLGSSMTNVVSFVFFESEKIVLKNVNVNYLQGNTLKSALTTTGGFAFDSKDQFSHFTAYCEVEKDGYYYFVDYVGYCNQRAEFIAKKGYKVEIEIKNKNTNVLYLKDLNGDSDKVYSVTNNKVTLYLDDLNYEFYCEYDFSLDIYHQELILSIDINTNLNSNIDGLILQ